MWPVLKVALDEVGVLPEREPPHFARSEPQHGEPLALSSDGTGRRRQRPKNPAKQAASYRGKKKTHGDKHVVSGQAKTKRVGFLSQTYAGKTHAKKIVETEPLVYPAGTTLDKDTGFPGYAPAVAQPCQPKKSPGRASSRRPRSALSARSHPCGSRAHLPSPG